MRELYQKLEAVATSGCNFPFVRKDVCNKLVLLRALAIVFFEENVLFGDVTNRLDSLVIPPRLLANYYYYTNTNL